jgi:outer membrane receptor protein involved in Fe transport
MFMGVDMMVSRYRPGAVHAPFAAAALTAALLPLDVRAQGPDADAAPSAGLEEIIVTARKREENLQEVPLSISVTTSRDIEQLGIKDVEDLIQQDPSVYFDTGFSPGDVRIVIRGLSPTRGRPNVATLVDGIDISSEAVGIAGGSLLATPRLLDIQQVEVVKGPQSALFGRSAFGGAINYVTKDPADEFEARVNVDGNDGEQYEGIASVSFPLGETFGVRLNGLWWDEKGFYKNTITGGDVGGGEGLGGALTLKWQPTENFSAKLRAEYTDDEFDVPAQAFLPYNTVARVPAAASACAPGGFVNDPSCPATPGPSRINGIRALEAAATAAGARGTWDGMSIISFQGTVPNADQLRVTFTPDYTKSQDGGITGPDYAGSDREVARASLVFSWDVPWGRFTSLTGITDADVSSEFDTDKFAIPGSQLGNDLSTVENRLVTWNETKQRSQEVRFTSDFDAPVNFVTGLQYWEEKVDQWDANTNVLAQGVLCVPAGPVVQCIPSSARIGPFMDDVAARRVANLTERDAEHKSAYLQLTWDIADEWGLSLEGRYVDEDNRLAGDDPVEVAFASPGMGVVYYADTPNSGASIVTLCGNIGPCSPLPPFFPGSLPRNPVHGFAPVGSGVVFNPALTVAPCPPFTPPTNSCIPPGTVLTNTGFIRRDFERNDTFFVPRGTVQWKPRDGILLYATYAEGEKPGGFSTLIGGTGLIDRETFEFKPERLEEYELGWKWRVTNNWILNGAFFREDFTDKQVSIQVAFPGSPFVVTRIDNAASAKIDGFEIDSVWRATEHLTIDTAFTYLDGEYENYRLRSNGGAEIARVGNCTPTTFDNGTPACFIDRSGNSIEDTPKYAFRGTATYRRPLGGTGLNWSMAADLNYTDQRFLEDDNVVVLDAYWLANFRLGLEGEKWSAIFYVNNVADDDTVKSASGGPGIPASIFALGSVPAAVAPPGAPFVSVKLPTTYFANLPDPRVFGLRVGFRF